MNVAEPSNPDKLALCAAEARYLALVVQRSLSRMPGNIDTNVRDIDTHNRMGRWFETKSTGMGKAAKEILTAQLVVMDCYSGLFKTEDGERVVAHMIARNKECIDLAGRMFPDASTCFEMVGDERTGMVWRLSC